MSIFKVNLPDAFMNVTGYTFAHKVQSFAFWNKNRLHKEMSGFSSLVF